jgi:hypothetical protein
MTHKHALAGALAALVIATSAATANADTIFNNFLPGNTFSEAGRLLQGPDVHNIGDVDQAVAFTVGPQDYFLTSVLLGLSVSGAGSPFDGTGPLKVEIASDLGGLPGSVLLSIDTMVVQPPTHQVVTVTSPGVLKLSANTTYWVIANTQGLFDGAWNYPDYNNPDAGPTAGRSNNGAWSLHAQPNDGRMALQVNGFLDRSSVPDDGASWALLGAGVCGLMVFSRGRQSAIRG